MFHFGIEFYIFHSLHCKACIYALTQMMPIVFFHSNHARSLDTQSVLEGKEMSLQRLNKHTEHPDYL